MNPSCGTVAPTEAPEPVRRGLSSLPPRHDIKLPALPSPRTAPTMPSPAFPEKRPQLELRQVGPPQLCTHPVTPSMSVPPGGAPEPPRRWPSRGPHSFWFLLSWVPAPEHLTLHGLTCSSCRRVGCVAPSHKRHLRQQQQWSQIPFAGVPCLLPHFLLLMWSHLSRGR